MNYEFNDYSLEVRSEYCKAPEQWQPDSPTLEPLTPAPPPIDSTIVENSPQVVELPTTYYKVRQYLNGETVFVAYRLSDPNDLTPGRDRKNEQLSDRARSKIKRAGRMMEYEYGNSCSFCTLTYRKVVPRHDQAKRHLDNFLKRLRRKYPELEYLWVAELQKRGAIHYHILFNCFIHHSIINKEWNEVVANWTKKQGKKHEKLYPNIQTPQSPARYMAKYLSKEGSRIGGNFYDMSKGIRSLIKPTKEYTTEVRGPEYPIIKDCQEALNNSQLDYFELKSSDEINMSNFSFYADQLDEGMKFQFGFFIPPQESSIDLISLLMQAIYPSMKNKISPN
jgi:hypothetical protein